GERFFANVASAGMSGAVAQRANGMSKALGGRVTFFYALTRVFLSWRNSEVTVELDDGVTRSGPMHDVVVANGQWHGGAMWLAPEAQPDDGRFDVVLIGDINRLDFATTAPKIYRGTYLAHPKVELLRSRTVLVEGPVPEPPRASGSPLRPRRRASRGCLSVRVLEPSILLVVAGEDTSVAGGYNPARDDETGLPGRRGGARTRSRDFREAAASEPLGNRPHRRRDAGEPVLRPLPRLAARRGREAGRPHVHGLAGGRAPDLPARAGLPGLRASRPRARGRR